MNLSGPIGEHENWNRRMLMLAFPIILANLAQPVLSLVDTMVAGHLPGAWYLAGVALSGVLFNFLFWSFSFLRMATTGLVAQAWGATYVAPDETAQDPTRNEWDTGRTLLQTLLKD